MCFVLKNIFIFFSFDRDGCKEFFHQLHTVEIPLLIFSAGLGDIISETIKQRATFYPENMKIVANFLEFDEMVGFFQ